MDAALRHCHAMNWIKALQKVRLKDADEVPKGWMTVRQLMEELGLERAQTHHKLETMVRAGVAEKKSFRISVGAYVRPTPHYRLK